jgi:hypothetical protein
VQTFALGDALADVGRLAVEHDHHGARVAVDAVVVLRVADALDRVARDLRVVDDRLRRDLAGDDTQAGRDERLARDARARIVFQERVEDRVRDLVGHLVGVTHGNGFRSEELSSHDSWRLGRCAPRGGSARRSRYADGHPSVFAAARPIPEHTALVRAVEVEGRRRRVMNARDSDR